MPFLRRATALGISGLKVPVFLERFSQVFSYHRNLFNGCKGSVCAPSFPILHLDHHAFTVDPPYSDDSSLMRALRRRASISAMISSPGLRLLNNKGSLGD